MHFWFLTNQPRVTNTLCTVVTSHVWPQVLMLSSPEAAVIMLLMHQVYTWGRGISLVRGECITTWPSSIIQYQPATNDLDNCCHGWHLFNSNPKRYLLMGWFRRGVDCSKCLLGQTPGAFFLDYFDILVKTCPVLCVQSTQTLTLTMLHYVSYNKKTILTHIHNRSDNFWTSFVISWKGM